MKKGQRYVCKQELETGGSTEKLRRTGWRTMHQEKIVIRKNSAEDGDDGKARKKLCNEFEAVDRVTGVPRLSSL